MVKKNYSKAEDLFEKRMEGLKIDHLLELAAAAEEGRTIEGNKAPELTPHQRLIIIEHEMIWMKNEDKIKYNELGIKRGVLKKYQGKEEFKEEELKEIIELQKNVKEFKKEHFPDKSNEDLVKSEREKHINKRHNVSDKWLPLQ